MRNIAQSYRRNVVPFPQRSRTANCLTQQDRQDVADLRNAAAAAGYNALMVHVVSISDDCRTTDYVAAYRTGEPWSSWGFARDGRRICSWNALTSADAGTFSSMSEALGFILLGAATTQNTERHLPSEDRQAAPSS